MDQRATIVSELESLIAQYKSSQYSETAVVKKIMAKCMELNSACSYSQFQFGSEFTPTKKPSRINDDSSDNDSGSLSDSESEESEDEKKVPKRKQPIAKKKSAFGGDGGSEESDSSDSDSSEEEVARKPKALLRKKKDPNAPKRPMSAYLIFATDKRVTYRQAHPEARIVDVSKALAVMWKESTDSEKQVYQEKAQQEKIRYEEQMRQYQANTSSVSDTKSPKKAVKKSATPVKKSEQKPDVKKPMSAYMYFVQDKREEVKAQHPEMGFADLAKEIGNMWKSMEEADKKPFVDQAAVDMERYQRELQ